MAGTRRTPAMLTFPEGRFIMEPSAEQVRRDILLLERNISDYLKPLQYSKQLIIDDVKEAFSSERDPIDGSSWPALSQRAEQVPRFGMLQRIKTNRRMYRAVTNKNSYGVTKKGVYLNNAVVFRMAPYAGYHQQDDRVPEGKPSNEAIIAERKRLFARGFGSKERTQAERIARIKEQADINLQQIDAGKIPQRRFLGPSKYSQELISKVFDRWAKDAIIIYRRGGTLVARRR
jgi:hypothetical protein